jgi:hypothetical protein
MRIWEKRMNKRILVGSIFVLTLLLLMPTIPAIQQKTIQEELYNDLVDQIDIKDIKEIKKLNEVKHPLLYSLIVITLIFRYIRIYTLATISFKMVHTGGWGYELKIIHPLLYYRYLMLLFTTVLLDRTCSTLSTIFGWNWKLTEI